MEYTGDCYKACQGGDYGSCRDFKGILRNFIGRASEKSAHPPRAAGAKSLARYQLPGSTPCRTGLEPRDLHRNMSQSYYWPDIAVQ